jgi:hypothetical protein
MRALQGFVGIAVLLGLGLASSPKAGWAEGCCKCWGCPSGPAVRCLDTAGKDSDCYEACDDCPSYAWDAGATCGVGAFADCLGTPEVQAPTLGSTAVGLAAAALLAAGVILLARRGRLAD